jgi:cell division cycle protein 20 (cofactor of APC complex)
MSQFKFVAEMNNLLTVEGPLTKGPPPRWQRKGQENYQSTSNLSLNSSKQKSFSTSVTKTPPTKAGGSDIVRSKKTPSKTPSGKNKSGGSTTPTPNKGAKTPVADRFIPVRSTSNFDLAHYKLNQDENTSSSPTRKELQRVMCENLHGGDIDSQKILSYRNKPPSAPEGFMNPMRVIYTQTKTPASVKSNSRYIPHAPDRILDAPDIVDDYYLNLMDWNSGNLLAVALGAHVYLWNAG